MNWPIALTFSYVGTPYWYQCVCRNWWISITAFQDIRKKPASRTDGQTMWKQYTPPPHPPPPPPTHTQSLRGYKYIDYIEKWPSNLYIFGIHLWTVLYPKPCYNEPSYKEVVGYEERERTYHLGSVLNFQRRIKSACTSAQSDEKPHFPHKETLHPLLSKMRPEKILIRLHECTVWSNLCWAHLSIGTFFRVQVIYKQAIRFVIIAFNVTLPYVLWDLVSTKFGLDILKSGSKRRHYCGPQGFVNYLSNVAKYQKRVNYTTYKTRKVSRIQ